jgi:arylsulfatase A
MKKSQIARVVTACSLFSCAHGFAVQVEKAPPNIILILTDDQGWSQNSGLMDPLVPAATSAYLSTPNMNRIAQQGMRFTSGYSPAPLCTPTRRSILCGTTAPRSGTEFKSESGWIPREHITIPKALKMASPEYRCAHFGKWGGALMASTPEECGYDASSGVTDNPDGGMPETLGYSGHDEGPAFFIDNEDPKRTFSVTGSAIDFMREQVATGHPFYVQASYYAPHLSVVCKEATLAKYVEKGTPDRGYSPAWAAMLEDLDSGIGQLLDAIDKLGVAGNTYLFFMSDNGGRGDMPGGDKERLPPNYPLTGAKQDLFEGGVRVPFMVRGPGISPQTVCRVPVAGYDLLPTFYDLAGGRSTLPGYVDGVSIMPLLANPSKGEIKRPKGALFFHRPLRLYSAVRQDEYKLMLLWNKQGAVRGRELYRVNDDPREKGHDIAAGNPAKADELQKLLIGYLKEVGAYHPPAAVPQKDVTGAQVIYLNDFDGATNGNPGQSATVSFGFQATANKAALNGAGQLVASESNAGSVFRVQLAPQPLTGSPIRLTAQLKAPSGRQWIGIGFQGEDGNKLNDDSANGGPWLQVNSSALRIRGGTGVKGTDLQIKETHAAGGELTLGMTYYPDQTLDVLLNGVVVTNGLKLIHEFGRAVAAPVIQYLQMQFFQSANDGSGFDRVSVETIPQKP